MMIHPRSISTMLRNHVMTVYNCRKSRYMAKPADLVQGTVDLLILQTISLGLRHGWAIAKRIQQVSHADVR